MKGSSIISDSLPVSIDSLKIRIPLEAGVQLISPQLQGGRRITHLLDDSTGEMIFLADEPNSRKAIGSNPIDDGAIATYEVKRMKHEGQELTDCLLVGASSKLLAGQYFRGITPKTIQQLYNGILQQGLVSFPFDAMWIHGKATDIDLKQDFIMNAEEYAHLLDELKKCTKLTNKKDRGYLDYKKQGIMWGDRKSSSPSCPFTKYYDKGNELNGKSRQFMEAHINRNVTNYKRIEAAVKNNKFLSDYGYSFGNKLSTIVMLPQETKRSILHKMIAKHIEVNAIVPYKQKEPLEGLTMNEYYILDAVERWMDKGMSKEQAVRHLLDRATNKDTRKYHKAKINEVLRKAYPLKWKQLADRLEFKGGFNDSQN